MKIQSAIRLPMSSLGRPSRNIFAWRVETKGVAERHTLEEPNSLQSGNVSGRPRPMRTRHRSWPPCPHTLLRRRRARQACSSKPLADQTVRCVIASRWPFASQNVRMVMSFQRLSICANPGEDTGRAIAFVGPLAQCIMDSVGNGKSLSESRGDSADRS
jgi:hypothetical protein